MLRECLPYTSYLHHMQVTFPVKGTCIYNTHSSAHSLTNQYNSQLGVYR